MLTGPFPDANEVLYPPLEFKALGYGSVNDYDVSVNNPNFECVSLVFISAMSACFYVMFS